MKPIDLTNQMFGRLKVIRLTEKRSTRCGSAIWVCECTCGSMVEARGTHLRSGNTQSCGCLQKEQVSERVRQRNYKHGFTTRHNKEPLYASWIMMKDRCYNEKSESFERYGGRGITVYAPWLDSYPKFRHYVLTLPNCPIKSDGHKTDASITLDRINNLEGYKPGNLRWASKTTQNNNKRNNISVRINGVLLPLQEAVKKYSKLPYDTVYQRIAVLGWSTKDAFLLPLYKRPHA